MIECAQNATRKSTSTRSSTKVKVTRINKFQTQNQNLTFLKSNYKYKRRSATFPLLAEIQTQNTKILIRQQKNVVNIKEHKPMEAVEQHPQQQQQQQHTNIFSSILNLYMIIILKIMQSKPIKSLAVCRMHRISKAANDDDVKIGINIKAHHRRRHHHQRQQRQCNADGVSTMHNKQLQSSSPTPRQTTWCSSIIFLCSQALRNSKISTTAAAATAAASPSTTSKISTATSANSSHLTRILSIFMMLFIAISSLSLRQVEAGACWQTTLDNGKCNEIFSLNITKAECCGASQEFSYTDRELDNVEYFFATALGGGIECAPCIESCKSVKCGPNKKCVKRKGRPKCICAPECGAAVRRKQQHQHHNNGANQRQQQQQQIPTNLHKSIEAEKSPRDVRSLSSEITNINLDLDNSDNGKRHNHQHQHQHHHHQQQHQQHVQQEQQHFSNQRIINFPQSHRSHERPKSNSQRKRESKHRRLLITANVPPATDKPTTRRIQILSNIDLPPYQTANGAGFNLKRTNSNNNNNNNNNNNDDPLRAIANGVVPGGDSFAKTTVLNTRRHNVQSRHKSIANEPNDLNRKNSRQRDNNNHNNNNNNDDGNNNNDDNSNIEKVRHIHQNVRQVQLYDPNHELQDETGQQQQQQQHEHQRDPQRRRKHHNRNNNNNNKKQRKHKDHNTNNVNSTTAATSTVAALAATTAKGSLQTASVLTTTPVNSTVSGKHRYLYDNEHGSKNATSSTTKSSSSTIAEGGTPATAAGVATITSAAAAAAAASSSSSSATSSSSFGGNVEGVIVTSMQQQSAAAIASSGNLVNTDDLAFLDGIYDQFNQHGFPRQEHTLELYMHHSHPVCGTDGRTYHTECQLKKRACRTDNPNLQVAYRGHCRTSCKGVKCLNGLTCVEDHYMIPHCIACKIECPRHDGMHDLDGDGQPDDDDYNEDYANNNNNRGRASTTNNNNNNNIIDPTRAVCGVDGKTYRSTCDINRMICEIGRSIAVAYPGPCRADRINCADINCGPKNTCLVDLLTHEPRCVSCRYKCSRKRQHSTRYEDGKICGVNNRTYNSWCELRKDSCATGFFIDVKAAGVCH